MLQKNGRTRTRVGALMCAVAVTVTSASADWDIGTPAHHDLYYRYDDVYGNGGAPFEEDVEFGIKVKVNGVLKKSFTPGYATFGAWAEIVEAPSAGWTTSSTEVNGTFELWEADFSSLIGTRDIKVVDVGP